MNALTDGKQKTRKLMSLLGVAACFALAAPPAFAGDGPASPQTQTAPNASGSPVATPAEGGLKGFIDPQTGEIRPEPALGTAPPPLSPQEQNAFSTTHQGLVEVPSAVPGGGVKLDLQGRFQSPLVGTIDANGNVKVEHRGEPPKSSNTE